MEEGKREYLGIFFSLLLSAFLHSSIPPLLMLIIRIPNTSEEWEQYYDLRFTVLREPWGQLKGSEVLTDEDQTDHAMVVDSETEKIVGVARMQTNSSTQGQVRCVAVSPEMQGRGVGKLLMSYLENLAQEKGFKEIVLDARENAVKFYLSIGYGIIEESYLLFGIIPHFKMIKRFTVAL